MSKMFW